MNVVYDKCESISIETYLYYAKKSSMRGGMGCNKSPVKNGAIWARGIKPSQAIPR
jgi:hypothetical protein